MEGSEASWTADAWKPSSNEYIKPQSSTDLLATGSALCFCRTGTEGLRVAPAALGMSGREADCVMVRMLFSWRTGDSKLVTLPLRRGGEVERADDSILVRSLSCSGFLSPPSGACRRAVNHTFTNPNVQPTGDKLILAYDVIYCECITLAVTAQQPEMSLKRSLVFVMKIDKVPAANWNTFFLSSVRSCKRRFN